MSRDCEKNYRELVDKLGVILNLPTVKESGMISVEDIRKLVPELKESEGEIIKKELIAAFQNGVAYNSISKERAKDYISWIEKHKQTPQWMIDFLNEHRSHFGVLMDYDEHREIEGKLLCIKQWLEGNYVEQKIQPKFKVGDVMRTLEEAEDGITDGLPIVLSVDERNYHCTNELIAIKDQDEYEYPPMNRKQKSAK